MATWTDAGVIGPAATYAWSTTWNLGSYHPAWPGLAITGETLATIFYPPYYWHS